jgi:hypothetical protein
MKGSGVFLVKLPSGQPSRQVYRMPGLAEDAARKAGGSVVVVKWNPAPLSAPRKGGEA